MVNLCAELLYQYKIEGRYVKLQRQTWHKLRVNKILKLKILWVYK